MNNINIRLLFKTKLKHTPAQVYLLIPQRDSGKQIPKEVQSAAKPPAERSEGDEVPSEVRLKGNVFDGTGWTGRTGRTGRTEAFFVL